MSPIILKNFQLTETETSVIVNINGAIGITKRNLDIFSSDTYIKIHSPPYFWELFLAGEITTDNSDDLRVTILNNSTIQLILTKKHKGFWNEIAEQIEDKSLMQQKRLEAIEAEHKNSVRRDAIRLQKEQEKKTELMLERMKLEEDKKRNADSQLEADKIEALQAMFERPKTRDENKNAEVDRSKRTLPPPRNHSTIFVDFTATTTSNSKSVG